MAVHHEMTANQKQRLVQHQLDLEMEADVVAWIEGMIHRKPATDSEEDYEKFIK